MSLTNFERSGELFEFKFVFLMKNKKLFWVAFKKLPQIGPIRHALCSTLWGSKNHGPAATVGYAHVGAWARRHRLAPVSRTARLPGTVHGAWRQVAAVGGNGDSMCQSPCHLLAYRKCRFTDLESFCSIVSIKTLTDVPFL